MPIGGVRSARLKAIDNSMIPPRGWAIAQKYPPDERPNLTPISRTTSANSTRSRWKRGRPGAGREGGEEALAMRRRPS